MPKKKQLFEFNLRFVEKYSGRVLVEAESAAEARRMLDEEWQNADYIYERLTDCPDDVSLRISRARPVTKEKAAGFSYHATIKKEDK